MPLINPKKKKNNLFSKDKSYINAPQMIYGLLEEGVAQQWMRSDWGGGGGGDDPNI